MPVDKGLKIGMAVGCLVLVPIIILVTLEYFNIGPMVTDADRANFAMQESNSTILNATVTEISNKMNRF